MCKFNIRVNILLNTNWFVLCFFPFLAHSDTENSDFSSSVCSWIGRSWIHHECMLEYSGLKFRHLSVLVTLVNMMTKLKYMTVEIKPYIATLIRVHVHVYINHKLNHMLRVAHYIIPNTYPCHYACYYISILGYNI